MDARQVEAALQKSKKPYKLIPVRFVEEGGTKMGHTVIMNWDAKVPARLFRRHTAFVVYSFSAACVLRNTPQVFLLLFFVKRIHLYPQKTADFGASFVCPLLACGYLILYCCSFDYVSHELFWYEVIFGRVAFLFWLCGRCPA